MPTLFVSGVKTMDNEAKLEREFARQWERQWHKATKDNRFDRASEIADAVQNETLLPAAIKLLEQGYTPTQIWKGFIIQSVH